MSDLVNDFPCMLPGIGAAPRCLGPRRAFTVIEVIISMVIFSLSILAIYSLQVVTISSLSEAREMTDASFLAERVLEQLRRDSTTWVAGPAPAILTPTGDEWASYFDGRAVNKDGLHEDVELPNGSPAAIARFCVRYRVSQVGTAGAGTLRVEVRVLWPRREGRQAIFAHCPDDMGSVANIPFSRQITLASSVYRHQGS